MFTHRLFLYKITISSPLFSTFSSLPFSGPGKSGKDTSAKNQDCCYSNSTVLTAEKQRRYGKKNQKIDSCRYRADDQVLPLDSSAGFICSQKRADE